LRIANLETASPGSQIRNPKSQIRIPIYPKTMRNAGNRNIGQNNAHCTHIASRL
jgi:hypothetical protein